LGTSGSFSTSGAYPVASNPVSRELRLMKTQLNVAVGQSEEDPERAWLELVSLRERLGSVTARAKGDPLLLADVERFRSRLDEQIRKLTHDVGDDVIAPLYSWLDLCRQRGRLDSDVESARAHVVQARASRGASSGTELASDEETDLALVVAEKELAWWSAETPAPPPQHALAVWLESGGDALRPTLPVDPYQVSAQGRKARALVDAVQGRALGAVPYVGSKLELIVVPSIGAFALLASMFTLASADARSVLGALAVLGWTGFAATLGFSAFVRQRACTERRAAIAVVWHHVLFFEQVSSLELEVGWLRALAAAMRARGAFDAHKGEGGQLAELARWRPDLEPVVTELAKSSTEAPPG
jgi:hypothetical protein